MHGAAFFPGIDTFRSKPSSDAYTGQSLIQLPVLSPVNARSGLDPGWSFQSRVIKSDLEQRALRKDSRHCVRSRHLVVISHCHVPADIFICVFS